MRAALAAVSLVVACSGGAGAPTSTSTTTSGTSSTGAAIDCEVEPDALFIKRIAPLLATDRPKTCNTCHLSGVDLEMFVQETPCRTMACLESRGLVDLADPAASVVLRWISRADPASPLIDQSVIDEEYAAFLAWIEATATCGPCWSGEEPCGAGTEATCEEDDAMPAWVDPGDCSPLTREALFRHRVYTWRDRCFPCHFDTSEIEAPKWIATGSCELGSLMTMRDVLERGLVNYDDPEQSLLLLKPLAESAGGVMHGGHDKFADKNDQAYVDFLEWISRETSCAP
ncbi:hypothetical protein [Nannocystis pusilla]|uniref:Cytochrome c domain-containing protein n=1 Tax=Nannocystis pusilla TaxID=889268 RepID=A0ABS7U0D5_9BACT|nr:hypothetical protein [Nannocystis pusilla]MBZ5713985.1 hypothetical protein [Nannocystis pusilla]